MTKPNFTSLCVSICILTACATEHHTADVDASAGEGGVGGNAMDSGSSGTAGTAGTSGASGFGGVGGSGGVGMAFDAGSHVGGSGGFGNACGTQNDIRTGAECENEADGWFAIKVVHDVWWQGVPTRDPGRGDIETYVLAKREDVCGDGSNGFGTLKVCGMRLPTFTSDVSCDAFQIEVADSVWERPNMPRVITHALATSFNPGGILSLSPATGLFGIDLLNSAVDDAWPTPNQTGSFLCEAGSGLDCFVDHDADGSPGIAVSMRHDEGVYSYSTPNESGVAQADTDTKYGLCTGGPSGTPYRYRGMHTGLDLGAAGGCCGNLVRATTLQVGIRARLGGGGVIGADCVSGAASTQANTIDTRAFDCAVDPATLNPNNIFDDRYETMNYRCTAAEAQFVDDNLPVYRALDAGEVPGDSMPPLGWVQAGRDIDKTPSTGSRSAFVRLANLNDNEPTCTAVRNAVFPAL